MIKEQLKEAKKACRFMQNVKPKVKNKALKNISEALIQKSELIIQENQKDIAEAKNNGIKESMVDRLLLNKERIEAMAKDILKVIDLQDPIGTLVREIKRPNGLVIQQIRIPLGVIGVIYESRPNVTCDAAGLCLKSGNATILRGGSDAINSNKAIVKALRNGIEKSGLPKDAIQLVSDTDREVAQKMMRLNEYIDVLIPRGGENLIKSVVKNATIPVIETGTGNCHIYVDESADFNMAIDIVLNAKTQRPGVCNAAEKLLIHENISKEFLPKVVKALREKNVEIRGDEKSKEVVDDIILAKDEEWDKEYLDYIIAVKIVENVDEAIKHINNHGTKHSEAIITESYKNSQKFLERVDAAAVYVNASTRFTDGSEFGFGAEIGISTQKLHARGPMGLKELTSTKYIIYGNGQIR